MPCQTCRSALMTGVHIDQIVYCQTPVLAKSQWKSQWQSQQPFQNIVVPGKIEACNCVYKLI